ncbi:MAG: P1 family peptidase [Dehalococcoidia bacterium]|nr:P1 family peptidase [Dehalococcoidia bacterium]
MTNAITDVAGIEVGHYTDRDAATGCTVVMCREGAVAGGDVRGGAPGTRETDLLRPENLVDKVHAVLLSGGSAFGLNASVGVMQYLDELGIGLKVGPAVVPIVPAAILFDLNLVTDKVRPGPEEGYEACLACSGGTVEEGSVGAGTGATVGKSLGMERAVKGGIGTASLTLQGGVVVGAIVAVNAYGGVVDHRTGKVMAGPRKGDVPGFHDPVELLIKGCGKKRDHPAANTTIGVVATNATLAKEQATYLSRVGHDGLALTIRPCHTIRDGDTIFALATGEIPNAPDLTTLGAAAVEVVARAVLRAVQTADGLGGVPSLKELSYSDPE